MKKSLLVLLSLSVSYFFMAQEALKQKEIGLVFSNLDNFGLTFKTGTNKSLWRINAVLTSGNFMEYEHTTDSVVSDYTNLGFGMKLGKEYRNEIVENLELRFGADLSFTYSKSKQEIDDIRNDNDRIIEQTTYRPGLNLVFGFNYVLHSKFVIGAELLPHFDYTIGKSKEKNYLTNEEDNIDISGFSYGLSNTSALISLAFRF